MAPHPNSAEPFARHEAQHMAEFLSRTVGKELCENALISSSPGCQALAERARDALSDLYQVVGNL